MFLSAHVRATVEAVEEAVLNLMAQAHAVVGRDGHEVHALPPERVGGDFAEVWQLRDACPL